MRDMNIGFWSNQLGERGTEVSLFDYAFYNQTLLGNTSFIFYHKHSPFNNNEIIQKFQQYFTVIPLQNFDEIDSFIQSHQITHLYIIKYGLFDNQLSKIAKNCVHCVFDCTQPHGDIYSTISSHVHGYNNHIPIVPHIIDLPNHNRNMRELLNIPSNAIVFGGYGGKDSFDIPFVHQTIYDIAYHHSNIYFIFANFYPFCASLPNILHLPAIIEKEKKTEFINTCDAMIWGRRDGETFGLAIGEFSSMNKPVICMDIGHRCHIDILKEKGIYYTNDKDLQEIIVNFKPDKEKDWNAYRDYMPEKVIDIFRKIYLD